MEHDFIRNKFIEMFGEEKYVEFVLSLYESFPLREKLFFWQGQLLKELCNDLKLHSINFEETYMIFNHCPIHDMELKSDFVPVLNGNRFENPISPFEEKKSFPLANTCALRDCERFKYPENIEILYCPDCRNERSVRIEKLN